MGKPRSTAEPAAPDLPAGTGADTGTCLRCHQSRPLDDDGFCDACRKALEEACL